MGIGMKPEKIRKLDGWVFGVKQYAAIRAYRYTDKRNWIKCVGVEETDNWFYGANSNIVCPVLETAMECEEEWAANEGLVPALGSWDNDYFHYIKSFPWEEAP